MAERERTENRAKAIFCASLMLLNACKSPAPLPVPEVLRPGTNESLVMIVPAKGVQILRMPRQEGSRHRNRMGLRCARCRALRRAWQPDRPAWSGTVLASQRRQQGRRQADAARRRPSGGAIPWLLLTSKSNGPAGSFSGVTSIQRVNTVGGVMPAAGCTSDRVGATERIPYTADYYFFSNDKEESFTPTYQRNQQMKHSFQNQVSRLVLRYPCSP